jgi:DNA invertase Pin-like site-specific DNA recombinase
MANSETGAVAKRFAVGYVSAHTIDAGPPLDAQHYEIADWCKSLDFTLVKVEGEVIRAGKPVDQRDALMRALLALRTGEARVLVVHEPERLGETMLEVATIMQIAASYGGVVAFTRAMHRMLSSEPMSIFHLATYLGDFEELAATVRRRVNAAARRAQGLRTGNLPRAYKAVGDGQVLVRDAAETAVVELVDELRAQGMSVRQIAEEMERRGVVTRGGKPMHYTGVHKILRRKG